LIRFDFDDRYRDESVDRGLPWFARVLLADLAFYFLFAFILGPWLLLAVLLWPQQEPERLAKVEEEETPLVFLQPPEIPREILRAQPPVAVAPPEPAAKPPERLVLPGNTRPFEAGEPPGRFRFQTRGRLFLGQQLLVGRDLVGEVPLDPANADQIPDRAQQASQHGRLLSWWPRGSG
jgi:hypothetical protein